MKLCILGGGGFRTPYVYQALLRDTGSPRVQEVSLYDVDEQRLAAMRLILTQLAEPFADAPIVKPSTDLAEAVTGSDFVFAALRVGGLEGRRCDEHVALDLSVLGQETTGPGGLAYAIRTVPVMVQIAQRIAELAPDAYVMNFTNPAGIITEAMQTVLGDRVLGICDTPSGLGRRVAGLLGSGPHPDPDGLRRTQPPGLDAPGAVRRPGRAPWAAGLRRAASSVGGGPGVRPGLDPGARVGAERVPLLLLLQPGRRPNDHRLRHHPR